MRHARLLLLLAIFAAPVAARAVPPPPAFPPGDATDVIQGVTVADPYRGLENAGDPAVQAWSDAENDRTRGYLDALPHRAAVAARLKRLVSAASPAYSELQARGPSLFALYNDPSRQQPSLVRLAANADPASRASVLDPNALDASGHTEIDWYSASPDGTKVAVSLSRNGSEDGVLHVYDVAAGREIETPIPGVQYPTAGGGVAWAADGKGFWYTRYPTGGPEGERHFNQQAYFHRLGAAAADDALALGAADGLPRTAEIFLDNDEAAPAALASVQLGDGGQWQVYVLRPGRPALKVARYEDRVVAAAMARDGTLYGLSRLGAPMGKVLKLSPPYAGGFAKAALFAPEQKDAAVVDGGEFGKPLVAAGKRLFVNRIAGGPSRVTVYDAAGKGRALRLPPIAAVGEIDALRNGDALFSVVTYLEPVYFARWRAATGAAERTRLAVTSPISFADATVTRAFAASKDGTRVPLNIIARKGVKLDGTNPVLLYGYGGYGVNQAPHFLGAMRRLWLDAGGVYVEANIRGGGEYGERWHVQGMLTRKQNVFDDFAAAGDWLIAHGYTGHDRLALMGGSNGGLLMGAEITQHPGLAHAVVSAVGIYDMLRVELDPNGAFNVTEFGTVKDPAQFKALYAYSPIHHVAQGTAYPAVLRTSKTSGHGIGSSLDDRIAEQTDQLLFLFDQVGMDAAAAVER
jgi:prolyl oligopeptidase